MTRTAEKYSLVEAALVFVLAAFAMAGIVILSIPLDLLTAWVRVQLWDWFAVPYLHLPHLSVWVMWGLGLLAFTFRCLNKSGSDDKSKSKVWVNIAVVPFCHLVALGVGFVIHHFVQ